MKHPILPVFAGLMLALAAAAVAVPAVPEDAATPAAAGAPAAAPATRPAAPSPPLGVVIHKADDTVVAGSLVGLEGGKVVVAVPVAGANPQRANVPLADVVEMRFDAAALKPAAAVGAAP